METKYRRGKISREKYEAWKRKHEPDDHTPRWYSNEDSDEAEEVRYIRPSPFGYYGPPPPMRRPRPPPFMDRSGSPWQSREAGPRDDSPHRGYPPSGLVPPRAPTPPPAASYYGGGQGSHQRSHHTSRPASYAGSHPGTILPDDSVSQQGSRSSPHLPSHYSSYPSHYPSVHGPRHIGVPLHHRTSFRDIPPEGERDFDNYGERPPPPAMESFYGRIRRGWGRGHGRSTVTAW